MEDKAFMLEPLFERLEQYGKTSYELYKLKTLNKTTGLVSTFGSRLVVALLVSMFATVVTIGVSLWLGDLFGKVYYGFFCVAGLYAVVGVVLYFFMRNWIKKHISNSIVTQILN